MKTDEIKKLSVLLHEIEKLNSNDRILEVKILAREIYLSKLTPGVPPSEGGYELCDRWHPGDVREDWSWYSKLTHNWHPFAGVSTESKPSWLNGFCCAGGLMARPVIPPTPKAPEPVVIEHTIQSIEEYRRGDPTLADKVAYEAIKFRPGERVKMTIQVVTDQDPRKSEDV